MSDNEAAHAELVDSIEGFLKPILEGLAPEPERAGAGRPRVLPAVALWAGVLVGVIRGFSSQLEVWRLLRAKGLWDFPHFAISDDAVYQRLQNAGRETFLRLWEQVTAVVRARLGPGVNHLGRLAGFATGVYALDGMTLDAVSKRLPALRAQPGAVLPGKLAAVFDLRAQVWHTLHFTEDAQANDKLAARGLLAGLEAGSLILADLGVLRLV